MGHASGVSSRRLVAVLGVAVVQASQGPGSVGPYTYLSGSAPPPDRFDDAPAIRPAAP